MRMAPRKEFQPSAMGGECRRVRSRGWRGRGARRASTRETMALSTGEVMLLGSTYGRRIFLIAVVVIDLI